MGETVHFTGIVAPVISTVKHPSQLHLEGSILTTADIRHLITRCYLLVCISFLLAQPGVAQPLFFDVSEGSGVPSNSGFFNMNIADYNNDGWPDLFSADAFRQEWSGEMLLLHNNGDGTFADQTEALHTDNSQQWRGGGAGFADFDNDGDLDLFVSVAGNSFGERSPARNVLLRNDRGIFTDVTVQAGLMDELTTGNAVWLDYDRDGYVDLFTGNPGDPELHRNKLYHNNGDGSFIDVTEDVGLGMQLGDEGGSGGGMAAGDFNDDGWPDLYLGIWEAPNRLFLSDGQGKFLDATSEDIGDSGRALGVAAGDFDGDGDLDIFQVTGGEDIFFRSTMLLNIGEGAFLDVTDAVGLGELIKESIRLVATADFDNDGDLDLITQDPQYLFLNDGDGTFTDASSQQPALGLGTIGDLNLDGFLDLWSGWGVQHNRGNENHYLRAVLEGTESNRSGIGTRLIATAGSRRLMREVRSGNGFHQQEMVVHFGLGSETRVDQLEIRWPSGQMDVLTGIAVGQTIRIIEGQGMYHEVQPALWERIPPNAVEMGSTTQIQAVVRPGLFERNARITSVVADLRSIGGPDAVPLTDRGDGTYALDTFVEVEGPAGVKSLFVIVEQATSLGTQWSRLVRPVTVVLLDEVVFAEGLGDNWKVESLEGAEVDLQIDTEVFEGATAMGLAVEPFVAEYGVRKEMDPVGYVALRFAFHPGTARLTEPATREPMAQLIFPSWRDRIPNDLYVMDADGGHMVRLIEAPESLFVPSWSPDGTKIVFQKNLSNSNSEIYVVDVDGSNPINLTNSSRRNESPSWSPDGTKIAFQSSRDGNNEIYVMDADGSNQANLTNHPNNDGVPSWSPDGTKIAFSSNRDGNWEIYVMDADGSHPVNLTNSPSRDEGPSWSPDGTRIAFGTNRDGNGEVYIMDTDGSNPVNLTNHPNYDGVPSWSPDGTKIAFGSDRDDINMIFVMDVDGTHLFNVSRYLGEFSPMWEGLLSWLPTVAPTRVLARFGVAVNGHLVSLLEKEERGYGVDLERNEWQVVEIPLENFMVKGPIHTITITGNLEGTFYLDDVRFVSEMSSSPEQTAVLEEQSGVLPDGFSLDQNYPNPFNSDTVIRFSLSEGADVELAVYNLAGQQVMTLVQGAREAGAYVVRWDGRDDGGRALASGMYLYRLRTANGQQVETRKLLLLK
jgi:Tol biopolymer transport system component